VGAITENEEGKANVGGGSEELKNLADGGCSSLRNVVRADDKNCRVGLVC